MTPCHCASGSQHLEGMYCLHLQGSSCPRGTTYRLMQHHIGEEQNLYLCSFHFCVGNTYLLCFMNATVLLVLQYVLESDHNVMSCLWVACLQFVCEQSVGRSRERMCLQQCPLSFWKHRLFFLPHYIILFHLLPLLTHMPIHNMLFYVLDYG
jgi:hypothetical protein